MWTFHLYAYFLGTRTGIPYLKAVHWKMGSGTTQHSPGFGKALLRGSNFSCARGIYLYGGDVNGDASDVGSIDNLEASIAENTG